MLTAVKERPILFSGEMVRAILDGRKTQTRRMVKPQPVKFPPEIHCAKWLDYDGFNKPGFYAYAEGAEKAKGFWRDNCPYGQPGDRLWVRESFWVVEREGQGVGVPFLLYEDEMGMEPNESAPYREAWGLKFGHKPSIHMPRWASRITLEITGVRVERLQGISEADCIAEGCSGGHDSIHGYQFSAQPKEHFWKLWESINGQGSWEANPYVWVIQFERIK